MSFEEYWETNGSRQDISDHKERARLAWEAAAKECDQEWSELVRDYIGVEI